MSLVLPPGVTVWKFDAMSQGWRAGLAGDLASVNELPPRLAPGEAIYVHAAEPIAAPLPDPAQRIAYYHQDHLGSSSVTTDATGALLEEAAYYPFGATRHERRPQAFEANYGFTQKERDQESGLHYFEARYLAGSLARFTSADPKFTHPDSLTSAELDAFLRQPQKLNPFAYALSRPLNHTDPTGLDEANGKPVRDGTSRPPLKGAMYDQPIGPMPRLKTEAILTLKESGGGKTHQAVIESFKSDKDGPTGGYGVGSAAAQGRSPAASDVHLVRKMDRLSLELQGAAVDGKHYESATIIVRTQGPKSQVIMEVKLSNVMLSQYVASSASGGVQPTEQISLNFTDISFSGADPNTGETSATWGSSPAPKSLRPNP
jgi:RHS repeat-associated protein